VWTVAAGQVMVVLYPLWEEAMVHCSLMKVVMMSCYVDDDPLS
jgi:hypothetical protein